MPPLILLWSPFDDYLATMLAALPEIRFARVESIDELAAVLAEAEAIIMVGHFYTAEVAALVRDRGHRLRWIQLTTAGYDGFTFHGVPPSVTVTNAGHSHAPAVAEHAVTLLCALTRRLPLFAELQARHVFDRAIALPLVTLEDATVVILGYGGIGRETARRLRAFDTRVIAVARAARPDDLADKVVASSDLHVALAQADALVITAALTEQTRGMVNAVALAAMKPGAVLVNVARGAIVDTDALIAALQSGHLAAAGLDVTDPEPPPLDHTLWDCPNLIITPHVSGLGSPAVQRRIGEVVRGNLGRFLAGARLAHVVSG